MKDKNEKNREEFATRMLDIEGDAARMIVQCGVDYGVSVPALFKIFAAHMNDISKKLAKDMEEEIKNDLRNIGIDVEELDVEEFDAEESEGGAT